MSKKVVGLAICAALLTLSFPAGAQQARKVPRIGILPPGPISERVNLWDAFRQGLRELGYVEGQNITLVFPSGEVKPERLPHLAAELVSLKVDVIVAAATVAVQNYYEIGRVSAKYVQRVVSGVQPRDLKVETIDDVELVINLQTAKQLGLTIPPNVLVRARKVIK